MAILGSGQRLPRGPLGFLAGLVGGLEPSMPAILAAQQRRREEAEKPKPPAATSFRQRPSSPLPPPDPDVLYPYPGTPEAAPTISAATIQTPRVEQFAASPRGGVGVLARLLAEEPRVALARGGVAPAGYFPGRTGGGRGRGSQQPVPGRSDADRYAQHLLRGGMPPELVQQLRAQYAA